MKNVKSPKWLGDISHHSAFIIDACTGRSSDDYASDEMLRLAVERSFEIIGEALNRLHRHDPDSAGRISHSSAIIGFRNILAHGYDIVEDAQVWKVIIEDLPVLRGEVDALISEG